MLRPLTTTVLWHPDPRDANGPLVASNHVGLAPVDAKVAHGDVLRATQFPPATKMLQHTLSFDQALPEDPQEALRAIDALYHQCTRCHLCASRGNVVTWRGNPFSPVVFLGESPGKEEDQLGTPLAGKEGTLQNELCKEFGIDPWNEILWMNIIGCRAARPWDRDRAPTSAELTSCSERTFLMLKALRPRVIICLGKVATRLFFTKEDVPPPWSFTQFTPPHDPESWVMVGHGHNPGFLVRVIGNAKTYREFAAARTFYKLLAQRMVGLTKVPRWAFIPRYLSDFIQARENDPPWNWDDPTKYSDAVASPVLRNLQES